MSEIINKVVTKHEIRGEVQVAKVYPELENLMVTPTKTVQSFNHPDSYGYNNVMVKAIDCEPLSVVPQKENQVFDGMYDKVNVRAIDCETLNITPKQENQSFNGMYDKVNVNAIQADTLKVIPSKTEQSFKGLYKQVNVEAIQGNTLDVTPKEEEQSFKGLYETVNIEAIETEEVTIDPDFSTQDTFEVTATEGKYITKATVNKDANLVPDKILEGEVVYGIEGTGKSGIDTSDATATAEDIVEGKTAYVNGEKITGALKITSIGGYTPLEYIESDGNQYINTGYYANEKSQYELSYSNNTGVGVLFGAYNSDWNNGSGLYTNEDNTNNGNTFFLHYNGNHNTYIISLGVTKADISINRNKINVNGNNANFKDGAVPTTSFTLNKPLYIFAGNMAGNVVQPVKMRLSNFTIKENGIVLHCFIPVIRNSDNAVCLYDLVNDKFAFNNGTGSFIAGPEI